jgi:4-hydroxymandelate oxidase
LPEIADIALSGPRHRRIYNPHLNPSLTWADLDWLRGVTPLPILCKGILRPDDADRAAASGFGVAVSNHGARNLDTVPATAQVLPAVVDAVAGRVPVLVDGGIRRGTDIAKALALGADAVLVGRPAIWGLAAAGAEGVADVIDILRAELMMAMALLGVPAVADLSRDALWASGR